MSVPKFRAGPFIIATVAFAIAVFAAQRDTQTRRSQRAIETRIDSIALVLTHLLQERAPRSRVDSVIVDDSGYASRGLATAKVVIVEFTDYQCPFCKKAAVGSLDSVADHYVNNGKVRHVVRDFPLQSIHKNAMQAAAFARCVANLRPDAYWNYRKSLYDNQNQLDDASILADLADAVGVSAALAADCAESATTLSAVAADMKSAGDIAIRGTPAYVIGVVERGNVHGVLIRGAAPFSVFRSNIEAALERLAGTS